MSISGSQVSTITFVQHCRFALTMLGRLSLQDEQFQNEDGSTDYDYYDHCLDIADTLVRNLKESCTNPTLPSYIKMLEAAQAANIAQ